jgi:2-iminobutanoate/2-iminopropanoate deaminase
MTRKIIYSSDALEPVGPYNQAVSDGRFVFNAGQIPLDPDTGQIVEGNFQDRVEQVIRNLDAVLEAGGLENFPLQFDLYPDQAGSVLH